MKSLSLLVVVALLTASTAHARDVTVESDESTDFSQIKTFAVHPGTLQSRNPSLNSSLVEKKARAAIVARLGAKGLTQVEEAPDVTVYFWLGSKERSESHYIPRFPGFAAHRETYRVTDETLVIDVRRGTDRKDLLFRAVCVDTEENAAKLEEHLDKSVDKALKDYPPKKKQG
jgi:Domain of unknown function (DUF4136)